LEDFLVKFPQSSSLPAAKLLLGQCDFLRGEYAKALGLFEELGQQLDKKDEILFWRGESYLKENHLAQAQSDYKTSLPKNTDFLDQQFILTSRELPSTLRLPRPIWP